MIFSLLDPVKVDKRYNSSFGAHSPLNVLHLTTATATPADTQTTPFRSNCDAVSFVGYRCIYAPLPPTISIEPTVPIITTILCPRYEARHVCSRRCSLPGIISCRCVVGWIALAQLYHDIVADFKGWIHGRFVRSYTGHRIIQFNG